MLACYFRVYFTPSLMGSFHLSLTVLVHYRYIKVSKLRGWFPVLQTVDTVLLNFVFHANIYRAFTFFGKVFELFLRDFEKQLLCSGSFATTAEVSVDFFWRY